MEELNEKLKFNEKVYEWSNHFPWYDITNVEFKAEGPNEEHEDVFYGFAFSLRIDPKLVREDGDGDLAFHFWIKKHDSLRFTQLFNALFHDGLFKVFLRVTGGEASVSPAEHYDILKKMYDEGRFDALKV
jgi:hypothetical protein